MFLMCDTIFLNVLHILLCNCCHPTFLYAQVFRSTSGEKLTEIQAHDDEVLCCAFSPDDRLLATCSSDRKVKVSRNLITATDSKHTKSRIIRCYHMIFETVCLCVGVERGASHATEGL